MATSRGAALRIAVSHTNYGLRLKLIPFTGKPLPIYSGLSGGANDQREDLYDALRAFRRALGDKPTISDWEGLTMAVRLLFEKGLALAVQTFGAQNLPEIEQMFNDTCPRWRQRRPRGSWQLPLIQVEALPEDIIPIEYLPLLNRQPPTKIENIDDLSAAMGSFVGFSAVIKRTDRRHEKSQSNVLDNVPKLPVKFFHHAALSGAAEEKAFFGRSQKWIDLEGPWPVETYDDAKQFLHSVSEQLLNPSLRFDGTRRLKSDQILHFACHCNTDAERSSDYTIALAGADNETHKLTIQSLQSCLGQLIKEKSELLPLVIFNACGSSQLRPARANSFPKLFLKDLGNRGFIGTETRVPDAFAALFSTQLYTALLSGERLGEALHTARWEMLRRYRNPLGILYTVYANPDMRVRIRVNLAES